MEKKNFKSSISYARKAARIGTKFPFSAANNIEFGIKSFMGSNVNGKPIPEAKWVIIEQNYKQACLRLKFNKEKNAII